MSASSRFRTYWNFEDYCSEAEKKRAIASVSYRIRNRIVRKLLILEAKEIEDGKSDCSVSSEGK